MSMNDIQIEEILKQILGGLDDPAQVSTATGGDCGVFHKMDDAIEAASAAQKAYLSYSMSDRARFVKAIREISLKDETLDYIARKAVDETGMGNYGDKIIKNRLAAEKTPGVEDLVTDAMSGDDGLTLVEYPHGYCSCNEVQCRCVAAHCHSDNKRNWL